MPMLRWCGGANVMSRSPTQTVPEVGCTNPPSMPSKVVLPEPDGPSSDTNSLGAISSDTSSSATTGPYRFVADLSDTPVFARASIACLSLERGVLRKIYGSIFLTAIPKLLDRA